MIRQTHTITHGVIQVSTVLPSRGGIPHKLWKCKLIVLQNNVWRLSPSLHNRVSSSKINKSGFSRKQQPYSLARRTEIQEGNEEKLKIRCTYSCHESTGIADYIFKSDHLIECSLYLSICF